MTEIAAWETYRNFSQKGGDRQFKTDKARVRLRRLYPEIQYFENAGPKPMNLPRSQDANHVPIQEH